MSHVGSNFSVQHLTLTFDQNASASLPINSALSTGRYLPTAGPRVMAQHNASLTQSLAYRSRRNLRQVRQTILQTSGFLLALFQMAVGLCGLMMSRNSILATSATAGFSTLVSGRQSKTIRIWC